MPRVPWTSRPGPAALVALALALAPPLPAQQPAPAADRAETDAAAPAGPRAFIRARVLPVVGEPIEDGVVVVEDGRITAVGPRGQVAVPTDAEIVDLVGKVLMPGLICTHSHIGEPWAADGSEPIQPDVRTYDAINVRDALIQRAQAGGITTTNIMSGSGHLMSGQTTYVKLRDGRTIDDLVLRHADGRVMGGMKMANGTNSQDDDGKFPGTRGKSAALVREAFVAAQEYQRKLQAAADDPERDAPERDLGLEALVEILEGRRIVHHHTHRHDDIVTVLRLSKEFGFQVVLHHVSDGWMVADEIAEAGAMVSAIVIDAPGGKLEAMNLSATTPAVLERAGVVVGVHTDDPIHDSRLFLRSAGLAVRAGMTEQGALESVTLAGAKMLGLEDRIGSLEAGKDADLVVLDGDPLSVYSLVEQTWVDGELVFDITRPEDRLSAYGGPGATNATTPTFCCFEDRRDR